MLPPSALSTEQIVQELTELLSERSATALIGWAATRPSTSLVVVQCPMGQWPLRAIELFGACMLNSGEARRLDLRWAGPGTDRWTVSEVDDLVISPSQLKAYERNVIVVRAAGAMDTRTAEHLLKTIEEPPAPSLFIFVVRSAAELLPTIVGRAGAVLTLEMAGGDMVARDLVADGAPEDIAVLCSALAGHDAVLARASALGGPETVSALRTAVGGPFFGPRPVTRAVEIVGAYHVLAKALAGHGPGVGSRADAGTLEDGGGVSQEKAIVRELTRLSISHWREQLRAVVPLARTPEQVHWAMDAARSMEGAEEDLAAYVSPTVVLAGLLCALEACPPELHSPGPIQCSSCPSSPATASSSSTGT